MTLLELKEKTEQIQENFSIVLYDNVIPEAELERINSVIENSYLKEPFDRLRSKYFIVAKNNNDIIGLVTYGEIDADGINVPRFLHIIITPEYKRSRLAYKLFIESEQELKKLGHKMIICYIRFDLVDRDMKIKLAKPQGYMKYRNGPEGEYFYKMIK